MKREFFIALSAGLLMLSFDVYAQNTSIDNGVSKATGAVKGLFKKKKAANTTEASQGSVSGSADNTSSTATPQGGDNYKVYSNYDFVPGDKILFADDFTADQDGEFPAHWELMHGQGVTNKVGGYEAFVLTEGNYVRVKPRVKTASYLGDAFTIEYDTYFPPGSYGLMVFFTKTSQEGNQEASVHVGKNEAAYSGTDSFDANLPASLGEENYPNKWHHIALAYKNPQLKVYVDQARVLIVPDAHMTPESVHFGGIASQDAPLIFRNVKIASGGGMNMIGKKFTDAKIVTHGINFDIDKATIRPESMGTLNEIKTIMTDNPDLKFEIDGHTDNSGTPAHNLTLSQERAEAVKAQLVSMGIAESRLTTKGLGDTKPLSDNSSPEGKANNRRVEFIRM